MIVRSTMPEARKHIGDFTASGSASWDGYWQTAVSEVAPQRLTIRGYRAEDIIANLSYAETLYLTMRGELPTPAQGRVLDAALCSAPDHGLISVHASAARFVASVQPDTPVPAIAAGLLCAGDVTISPKASATLIERGLAMIADGRTREQAAGVIIDEHLAVRSPVPGLGHPNHKEVDPRAAALRKVAEDEGVWAEGGAFYDALREAFISRKKVRLPMNVDGALASVLHDLGFAARQMPGIALLAILPGIIAHVDEETTDGIPMRVIPDSVYTGVPPRPLGSGHWATPGDLR
jgi:citryl-CoA lyase